MLGMVRAGVFFRARVGSGFRFSSRVELGLARASLLEPNASSVQYCEACLYESNGHKIQNQNPQIKQSFYAVKFRLPHESTFQLSHAHWSQFFLRSDLKQVKSDSDYLCFFSDLSQESHDHIMVRKQQSLWRKYFSKCSLASLYLHVVAVFSIQRDSVQC